MRVPRFFLAACAAALTALAALAAPAAAAELVMFESAGCPYCIAWHREIGPIYPKTDEAKRAALRRVDVAAPRPADLAFIRGIVYTPTFVLVEDGREIGRIVGYRGDEAFWALLGELIGQLKPPAEARPTAASTTPRHRRHSRRESPSATQRRSLQ